MWGLLSNLFKVAQNIPHTLTHSYNIIQLLIFLVEVSSFLPSSPSSCRGLMESVVPRDLVVLWACLVWWEITETEEQLDLLEDL